MSTPPSQPPKANTSSKVLLEILTWSVDQPVWQRDAVRRIVLGLSLEEVDYGELLTICKRQQGLLSSSVKAIKPEPLSAKHFPADVAGCGPVVLTKLADLKHVNKLPEGRSLAFGPTGLSVIYGDNGAGKSSFAKVLKRACRARNRGDAIRPNVFLQPPPTTPAEASFSYVVGTGAEKMAAWVDDGSSDVPELGQVSFFDSSCANIHVTKNNDIAYLPFGLDVLETLGGVVCKRVKKDLERERDELQREPAFLRHANAKGEHSVAKVLSGLTATSATKALRKLGTLSDQERERLAEIPSLAKDPRVAAKGIRQRTRRAESLKSVSAEAQRLLTKEEVTAYRHAINECRTTKEAARIAAEEAFSGEPLSGIGSDTWTKLWDAARRFSEAEAYPDESFPATGDGKLCVLCEQPLSANATGRLRRFEEFVKNEAKRKAEAAAAALAEKTRSLKALRLRNRDLREGLEALSVLNGEAAVEARKWLTMLRLHRRTLLRVAEACKGEGTLTPFEDPVPNSWTATLEESDAHATALESSAEDEGLKALRNEHVELTARDWLGGVMGEVLQRVRNLRRLVRLERCLADVRTNAITAKSKSLAESYITDQIRNAFANEMKRMDLRGINVELVQERGQAGQTLFRVRLVGASNANVGEVLSEGELRAIGLAAFLSELSTCGEKSTIVFDDPVTSLDHRWRAEFARRVVEEAASRQVIVFTHDLVFLHDLVDQCAKQQVALTESLLFKGTDGVGMLSDELPWRRQNLNTMFQTIEQEAVAAKRLYDAQDYEAYEAAAAKWYDRLRAVCERVVERHYLNETILRYNDYIKVGNLRAAAALDKEHCDRLHVVFQHCSTVIEGHDPSPGRNPSAPSPQRLFDDLKEVKALVDEVRESQKNL